MIETQVLMAVSDLLRFFSRNHFLEGGFTGLGLSLGGHGEALVLIRGGGGVRNEGGGGGGCPSWLPTRNRKILV